MAIISCSRAVASALLVTALVLLAESSYSHSNEYYIGEQGQSCKEACDKRGLVCSTEIETDDSIDIFGALGVACQADNRSWWAHDQPCYVSGTSSVNYGRCLGYRNVSSAVSCTARYNTVSRLCRCRESSRFLMGFQGEDCNTACSRQGLQCSTDYTTLYGSVSKFAEFGVSCIPDFRNWWAHDQPCYVSSPRDSNYRRCLGFINTPTEVSCSGKYPTVQRLCHCV